MYGLMMKYFTVVFGAWMSVGTGPRDQTLCIRMFTHTDYD